MVYSSITLCVKHVVRFSSRVQRQSSNQICNWISQSPLRTSQMPALWAQSYSYSFVGYQTFHSSRFVSNASKQKRDFGSFSFRSNKRGSAKTFLGLSEESHNMSLQISRPITTGPYWSKCKATSWLFVGLLCYASLESVHADSDKPESKDQCNLSPTSYSHGKKVCTDYSVIGIPGDGRCLFRSVAHGACLRAGNPAPRESLQRELADDLRSRVADELVKRRAETECFRFIEGDFDKYVEQMRRPHVWGGEPELLLSSHVLQMPITVYMHDADSGGLIAIAEYGQEYGKDDPINVLYHGFGHYDALQIPGRNSPPRSRI